VIATSSLARAQSIIASETSHVTLAVSPQSSRRLVLTATVTGDSGGDAPGGTLKFVDETAVVRVA
jgi:hypothetical protein